MLVTYLRTYRAFVPKARYIVLLQGVPNGGTADLFCALDATGRAGASGYIRGGAAGSDEVLINRQALWIMGA